MKKFLLMSFMAAILAFGIQNSANATGIFYTNATYPVTATGSKVPDLNGLKKGTASTKNILFFVEVGDASINKAAKKAGIQKICYVDMKEKSIFFFYRKLTVNVYGE